MGPRPTRVIPRREQRQERNGLRPPANPGTGTPDRAGAQILEAGRGRVFGRERVNGVEGKGHRKMVVATARGEIVVGESPGAPPARNKAGRVGGGVKRQEVEKT